MTAVPRLLFVHAHPDDETITCGGTMARYAATGAHVTVVTCTRGELGEVIPKDLAHLEAAQTEADRTASGRNGDELAAHREGELAEAMQALRVVDHASWATCRPGETCRRAGSAIPAWSGGRTATPRRLRT